MSDKQLAPIDAFKVELNRDYSKQVQNFFYGDKDKAMRFMSALVYSVQKTPALLECDKATLFSAAMTCAEYGLYPSNASGEAFILPYAGKAQFQLGYQGVITLLYGAGVESISASIVRKNDYFEFEEGLEQKLIHRPDVMSSDRGEPIGVYAIAVVNGQKMFKVMNKAEIMKIKEFSKAKDSKYSPWNGTDPELWMWKKTCIKQLAKLLPKNEKLMKAIEEDNKESIIGDRLEAAREESKTLAMGNLEIGNGKTKAKTKAEKDKDSAANAESATAEAEPNLDGPAY